MTHRRNFPLRAALVRAACGNGTIIHNASHPAVQHKIAASSRMAGSFSSAMT
jgi:hypothetical protein